MATTKKKTIPKKLSTSKNAKGSVRPWSWRFSIITIGIYTIAVVTIVLAAFFVANSVIAHNNEARLSRIDTIYKSLDLDDSYRLKSVDLVGDKRVYDYDDGRTFSSKSEYIHGDTVTNTLNELDEKIKAAGFSFVGEPYPGSTYTQFHYKSATGEFIRVTVSSKPYDDATTNAYTMNKDTSDIIGTLDKNAGPSNVTIKVNLDDTNE